MKNTEVRIPADVCRQDEGHVAFSGNRGEHEGKPSSIEVHFIGEGQS
jgi:hypothetical protein